MYGKVSQCLGRNTSIHTWTSPRSYLQRHLLLHIFLHTSYSWLLVAKDCGGWGCVFQGVHLQMCGEVLQCFGKQHIHSHPDFPQELRSTVSSITCLPARIKQFILGCQELWVGIGVLSSTWPELLCSLLMYNNIIRVMLYCCVVVLLCYCVCCVVVLLCCCVVVLVYCCVVMLFVFKRLVVYCSCEIICHYNHIIINNITKSASATASKNPPKKASTPVKSYSMSAKKGVKEKNGP